ncbi:hypothetical protein [Lactococcus termiticola]|uniref:Lipoprotein n=1 Tax=Lactococcus termiticola TaxID=2169526 RepID=A0A2R5HI47_9LACT|nr:hypothetical protein [Lactococcus termiticola]GBG95918.1 hypothetical protein NtB2_00020 [Lactococcus termiticola]
MKKIAMLSLATLTMFTLAACGGGHSDKSAASSSSAKKSSSSMSKTAEQKPVASSSETVSSSSTVASSSSSSSEKQAELSFDALDVTAQAKLYAAWLQNPEGQFVFFNQGGGAFYIINEGPNGARLYTNGQKTGDSYAGLSLVKQRNTVKVLVNGDSIEMYAPGTGSSFDGDWNNINWTLKEKLSKADLMSKFYTASQTNNQVVENNTGAPN